MLQITFTVRKAKRPRGGVWRVWAAWGCVAGVVSPHIVSLKYLDLHFKFDLFQRKY